MCWHFWVSGSFESIICTNGSVGILPHWLGHLRLDRLQEDDRMIKIYCESVNINGELVELCNFWWVHPIYWRRFYIIQIQKAFREMAMWSNTISSVVLWEIAAAIVNYFILLPLFEIFMPPLDQLIASFGWISAISLKTKLTLCYSILDCRFNILKGRFGIGAIAMMIYKTYTDTSRKERNLKWQKWTILKLLVDEIPFNNSCNDRFQMAILRRGKNHRCRSVLWWRSGVSYFLTARKSILLDQLTDGSAYGKYPQLKTKLRVKSLRGKIKEHRKKESWYYVLKKIPYMEENLSRRYERCNRSVSVMRQKGKSFWYQQSIKYIVRGYYNNQENRKLFRQVILLEKTVSDVSRCVILYARKSVLIYLQFQLLSTRIIVPNCGRCAEIPSEAV